MNYLRYIENRILSIAYRLNILPNIFLLFNFIKGGQYLYLNYKLIFLPQRIMMMGEILTLNKKIHNKLAIAIKRRIK